MKANVFPMPVCLFCLCGLLLAGAGEVHAAWFGKDGSFIFSGHRYDPEASVPEGLKSVLPGRPETLSQLTTDPTDGEPQVSPDGQWIVFSRSVPLPHPGAPGQRRIFIIDAQGGSLRQVSTPPVDAWDGDPTFDPSGSRIIFVRSNAHGTHVYSMLVDGGPARQLTSGKNVYDGNPAVSPNNRRIVFDRVRLVKPATGEEGPRHIYSMRSDGSRLVDLTAELGRRRAASDPDLSPNGRLIAFSLASALPTAVFTMKANGTRLSRVTRPRERNIDFAQPAFSPSGEWLVLTASSKYGSSLARVRADAPDGKVSTLGRLRGGSPVWAPTG
jgi:Tol biopolymer transport system component